MLLCIGQQVSIVKHWTAKNDANRTNESPLAFCPFNMSPANSPRTGIARTERPQRCQILEVTDSRQLVDSSVHFKCWVRWCGGCLPTVPLSPRVPLQIQYIYRIRVHYALHSPQKHQTARATAKMNTFLFGALTALFAIASAVSSYKLDQHWIIPSFLFFM